MVNQLAKTMHEIARQNRKTKLSYTNADRIRAMNDEELARLLCTADWCDLCNQVKEDGTCHAMELGGPLNQYCVAAGRRWLTQPAKEEE